MSQYPVGEYRVIICRTWKQRLWGIWQMLRECCGIAICTINPDIYDDDAYFDRWKRR